MRSLFLGKISHWLTLVLIAIVLWGAGQYHLHVTRFNAFVSIVLLLALAAVALVVLGYRRGDAVMREPIEPETDC